MKTISLFIILIITQACSTQTIYKNTNAKQPIIQHNKETIITNKPITIEEKTINNETLYTIDKQSLINILANITNIQKALEIEIEKRLFYENYFKSLQTKP